MATAPAEAETRQRLLRTVKKEVKQIMEEAVTRKFVHEDSSHIISFCAAVEACVLHGLRRRAAGFLRSNKIAALFMKVGKSFAPAEELSRKVQDLEQLIENARNQLQGLQENVRKLPKLPNLSPQALKHLWIRTALFEKVLDKIVHYLVENSSKYYEKEALLMDPVDGPILASLLVGPCALEYTKMKTADHFWTDPSADELVQRHRIHSSHLRQDSPTKRPALCIQKRHSSGSMDDRPSLSARDYVESLHQNSRATLLYGKNNVLVQPRDDMEAVPGYLSLHQTADVMTLKWTPNQLMNGSVGDLDYEKSVYWDYAMTIRLEEIVYLHCHQQVDSGGTVVLVSQDGIQRPPFRFPKGGHLLQFLSCLENGLLPHGQLDPPLWSQRGKGKVFPKLRKRSPQGSSESASDKEDDEATDYVFRIIYPGMQSEFGSAWMVFPLGRTMVVMAVGHLSTHTGGTAIPTLTDTDSFPPMPPDLIDAPVSSLPSMWQPSPRKSSCSSCSQSGSTESGPSNGCNHESYIWQHIEIGYVQGMCDLLAPLLVILDDEALAFSCFTELMKRMNQNFPHGGAMDTHFANMRSLIQILDSELFELMHQNGDYTHFYFCYRWFLLDFKRELVYDDVFSVWETIWAAKHVSSSHYVLFIALALVEIYRDIILENNMDFTDIIKFFNEMAERHNTKQILKLARDLVYKVQTLIENK
ncbi:small G protein signaling modulator 1 [Gracilinanus agilis]|uniref:small G protein signaling modulator 1 n=1 Tax=Gracilinanus agilis TaxID=191870 RepID=UPI001CFC91DF|nr:small G protein signaling modulator 1 [Gracilinanus agilis]